jgi:hypothetical protein
MDIARVFLPQVAEKFDPTIGRKVPAFDFSAAAQFGQLTEVLEPGDNPLFIARITPKIRAALEDFGENDYLLAVGDPTVIAICAGLILRRRKTLKMLKWERNSKTYIALEVNP